jgi:hypothetical protein
VYWTNEDRPSYISDVRLFIWKIWLFDVYLKVSMRRIKFPSVLNKWRPIHHTSAMYGFLYERFDYLMYIWKFRCVELKIMTNNENN